MWLKGRLLAITLLCLLLGRGYVWAEDTAAATLSPGDKLSIRVAEDNEYGGIYPVSENGLIILPLLNEIKAAGISPEGLAATIKERLEAKYYRQATVTVTVMERGFRGGIYGSTRGDTGLAFFGPPQEIIGKIWVSGQVVKQGPVGISRYEKLTVAKAIIACGGFNDFADARRVMVTRKDEKGKVKKFNVDVNAVLNKGMFDKDMELQDGDWITVRTSFFKF